MRKIMIFYDHKIAVKSEYDNFPGLRPRSEHRFITSGYLSALYAVCVKIIRQ